MPTRSSISLRGRLFRRVVRHVIAPRLQPTISIEKQRGFLNRLSVTLPLPRGTRIEPTRIDQVSVEWINPSLDPGNRIILYLHGGGYNIGSLASHRAMVARLARAARARALLVDYRLAPEHPHPAAVEDAVASYRWLLRQDVQPGNVIIAGDSAGGGLTLATLMSLRDGDDPLPAAAVCFSPWTDVTLSGETIRTLETQDPMLNLPWIEQMAAGYTRGGVPPDAPLVSPLFADLAGLPPLLVQVGSEEMLLSDAQRLELQARPVGVPITLEVWPRMWHVWQLFGGFMPEANRALDRVGDFIGRHCR